MNRTIFARNLSLNLGERIRASKSCLLTAGLKSPRDHFVRHYKVLAIETSCDDTCVAVINRPLAHKPATTLLHLKSTLDSVQDGGIIPIKAHHHHSKNLLSLVQKALRQVNREIDVVCVTQGPGMAGSLTVGMEVAKGVVAALSSMNRKSRMDGSACESNKTFKDVKFIGVHHMLGHLLVGRMESNGACPRFPFLSLLISGGHTILVLSKSVIDHVILAESIDIACGDALDKCSRILGMKGVMLGKELEKFVFEDRNVDEVWQEFLQYRQLNNEDPVTYPLVNFSEPLRNAPKRVNFNGFSLTAFSTMLKTSKLDFEKLQREALTDPLQKRVLQMIGFETQFCMFQHIVNRIKVSLQNHGIGTSSSENTIKIRDFVCSGGVGSNQLLRRILEKEFPDYQFTFPPVSLCTDNAVMIAWAGIELLESRGYTTDLLSLAIRKWPLSELNQSEKIVD